MGLFGKKQKIQTEEELIRPAYLGDEGVDDDFVYDAISDRHRRERFKSVRRTFAAVFFAFIFLMPSLRILIN